MRARLGSLARDFLIWPAVIVGDAYLLLVYIGLGFLVVQRLNGGHFQLVIVGTGYGAAYIVAAMGGAVLGVRKGFKKTAVGACVFLILAPVLMVASGTLPALAVCAALLGAAGGAMWPNLEAELSRGRQGVALRRRLSVFNITWSLGTLAGPVLCGLLYPSESVVYSEAGRQAINRVFLVSSFLAVAMVALLLAWQVRIPDAAEASAAKEEPHDPRLLRAFLRMSYVANLMCFVVVGVFRQLYEALADYLWQGQEPARIHSGLLAVLAAASTLTFLFLSIAHRWPCRLKRFILGQLCMLAGLAVIAFSSSPAVAAVGFALAGGAAAFFYSGSLYYSIQGRKETEHLAGWHEMIIGIGKLGGILLGLVPSFLAAIGVANEGILVRSPYLALVILFALACIVQLVIYAASRPACAGKAAP